MWTRRGGGGSTLVHPGGALNVHVDQIEMGDKIEIRLQFITLNLIELNFKSYCHWNLKVCANLPTFEATFKSLYISTD